MAPSLKERYGKRQLQSLQERARAAETQLLSEQRVARLIVEAMGEDDLQKVSAIIQKLDTIKSPELPTLTAAIEKAQAELNKYTGGGPITAAWTKLKGLVGVDNPVVKITTFADALERGFSQIPQILKNNGVNLANADLSKSLTSILKTSPTGAKGGEGGMKSSPTDTSKSPGMPGKPEEPGSDKYEPALKGPGNVGAKSDQEMGKSPFTGKTVPDKEKIQVPEQTRSTAAPVAKRTGGQDLPPKPGPGTKTATKSSAPKKPGFSASQEDWFKKGQAEGQQVDETDGGAHGLDEADPAAVGDQKLKSIIGQMRKALAPGGIFGAFKKVPYIDSAALAQELVAAPVKVFANVAKRIQSGAKAAEIAPDMKDQIQGQGGAQTRHSGAAEPGAPAAQSQPGAPTKPTTATTATTGAGQKAPRGPGEERGGGAEVRGAEEPKDDTKENFRSGVDRIVKGAGVDSKTAVKLLRYLMDNKLVDRSAISTHGVQGGKPKAA